MIDSRKQGMTAELDPEGARQSRVSPSADGPPFDGHELRDLLAPLEPDVFFKEYWQVRSAFIKGVPEKFSGLFDRERFYRSVSRARELDHIASFRLNALRSGKEDEPLTLASMECIVPEDVDRLLAEGMTICVNDICAVDDKLSSFARAVKLQMGYVGNVRFNCYLSPDGSGADRHFDARVSTTLQIEGRKRWRFSPRPAIDWPLSNAQIDFDGVPRWMSPWSGNEGWERLEPVDEDQFDEVILEPGDVLCLPAGTWHSAKAIGGSLALNLAFSPMAFFSFLSRMLEAAFLSRDTWRSGPPPTVAEEMTSDRLPMKVEFYLAERLQELRDFLEAVDTKEPGVFKLWQDLVKGTSINLPTRASL